MAASSRPGAWWARPSSWTSPYRPVLAPRSSSPTAVPRSPALECTVSFPTTTTNDRKRLPDDDTDRRARVGRPRPLPPPARAHGESRWLAAFLGCHLRRAGRLPTAAAGPPGSGHRIAHAAGG